MTDSALAQSRIGTAVRVVNDVTADLARLSSGDGVNQDQEIAVGDRSVGEFKLDDDTKLALGPGAVLKLDRFVYDPGQRAGDVAVSLAKGAFRFVSGAARKRDYKIRTPNAAISVRGTVFDVYIAANGAEYLLLHRGAIEICKGDGSDPATCRLLINPCNVVRVSPQGTVGEPNGWLDRSSELDVTFSEAFPFVLDPPQVDPVIYHARADVEANACSAPADPIRPQRATFDTPGVPAPPSLPPRDAIEQIAVYEPETLPPERSSRPNGPSGSDEDPGPADTPHSWTGIYIGVHGGGTLHDRTARASCADGNPGAGSYCSEDGDGPPSDARESYGFNGSSALGGAQIGGNIQFGALVLGLEADIARTRLSDEAASNDASREFFYTTTLSQKMSWFGTARARAGLAFGNVLLFATGGLAVGDVSYGLVVDDILDPATTYRARRDATKAGWTGGGGIELGLGALTLKTEYLYYDLGRERFDAAIGANRPFTARPDFDTSGHIIRMGINVPLN